MKQSAYMFFTAVLSPKDTSDPLYFILGVILVMSLIFVVGAAFSKT